MCGFFSEHKSAIVSWLKLIVFLLCAFHLHVVLDLSSRGMYLSFLGDSDAIIERLYFVL